MRVEEVGRQPPANRALDVPTDDPLRCKLRDGGGFSWRCHKYAGHVNRCSTHMDCGEIEPDGYFVCGFEPEHTGPHAWEL